MRLHKLNSISRENAQCGIVVVKRNHQEFNMLFIRENTQKVGIAVVSTFIYNGKKTKKGQTSVFIPRITRGLQESFVNFCNNFTTKIFVIVTKSFYIVNLSYYSKFVLVLLLKHRFTFL